MTAGSVLVVGAGGQVGGALLTRLGHRGRGTWRHPPEGRGGVAFELHEATSQPDRAGEIVGGAAAVCIAAGMTWVDGCEDHPDEAFQANRDGPVALARAARAVGARTVYFSTDYVFDGAAGPYGEDDHVRPLSVYGQSKWEGEQAVAEADPDALVVRTTVVWGPEANGRNFAYQLVAKLRAGEPMTVPDDQVSSPTYNRDLAAATLDLLDAGVSGVVHVAGPEALDRVTFARRLALGMDLDPDLIRPVSTAALGARATRPLQAGLAVERLRQLLPGVTLRPVEAALADWAQRADRPWAPVGR